jgi:hypothetical protein
VRVSGSFGKGIFPWRICRCNAELLSLDESTGDSKMGSPLVLPVLPSQIPDYRIFLSFHRIPLPIIFIIADFFSVNSDLVYIYRDLYTNKKIPGPTPSPWLTHEQTCATQMQGQNDCRDSLLFDGLFVVKSKVKGMTSISRLRKQ